MAVLLSLLAGAPAFYGMWDFWLFLELFLGWLGSKNIRKMELNVKKKKPQDMRGGFRPAERRVFCYIFLTVFIFRMGGIDDEN
jgi:hypothetical protein